MRSFYVVGITTLLAAGPAMGQVVIQTPPNPYQPGYDQRSEQERSHARWEQQEAQRRAARGDYEGAAQAQREARHEWHHAERDRQWEGQQQPGGIVIGPR